MKKIRKKDKVVIISGKDKGKIGVVLNVSSNYVIIDGLNVFKKSVKPNPSKNIVGGIKEKNMPLHISNVSLCNSLGRPLRVGFKINNGKKKRFFKKKDN